MATFTLGERIAVAVLTAAMTVGAVALLHFLVTALTGAEPGWPIYACFWAGSAAARIIRGRIG